MPKGQVIPRNKARQSAAKEKTSGVSKTKQGVDTATKMRQKVK